MQLTILDAIIKATLVLAIAAAAAAALRRASASTRHLVWTLGMLGALSAPLLSFAVPRWELPLVQLTADAPAPPLDWGQTPDVRLHTFRPPRRCRGKFCCLWHGLQERC